MKRTLLILTVLAAALALPHISSADPVDLLLERDIVPQVSKELFEAPDDIRPSSRDDNRPVSLFDEDYAIESGPYDTTFEDHIYEFRMEYDQEEPTLEDRVLETYRQDRNLGPENGNAGSLLVE